MKTRSVDREAAARLNRFLVVFVAPFFGVIMFVAGSHNLYRQVRYDIGSVTITGTVVAIEPSRGTRPSTGPNSTKIDYQFTTHDGQTLQGRDSVSGETRRELREGGPVFIQYLSDDPSTNQIHEVGEEWLYAIWICIGAGLIAVSPVVRGWCSCVKALVTARPRATLT